MIALNARNVLTYGAFVIASFAITRWTQASMTLTPAGVAGDFSIEPVLTGLPNSGAGTIAFSGIGFRSDGEVIVADNANGGIYDMGNDSDNQTAPSPEQNDGAGNAGEIAQIFSGSSDLYYLSQPTAGQIVQINPATGATIAGSATSLPGATGIVILPSNAASPADLQGHLLVSTTTGPNEGIYDVDPVARTATLFIPGVDADELSSSPDGSVLYVADTLTDKIIGYNTTTKAVVYTSNVITALGGVAVGIGNLTGILAATTTDGNIYEVSLNNSTATLLATGGSDAEFDDADPLHPNGPGLPSLVFSQSDGLYRLDPPGGGFYTSNIGSIQMPEPSGMILLLLIAPAVCSRRLRRPHTRLMIALDQAKTNAVGVADTALPSD